MNEQLNCPSEVHTRIRPDPGKDVRDRPLGASCLTPIYKSLAKLRLTLMASSITRTMSTWMFWSRHVMDKLNFYGVCPSISVNGLRG